MIVFILIALAVLFVVHMVIYSALITMFAITSQSGVIAVQIILALLGLSFLVSSILAHIKKTSTWKFTHILYWISFVWLGLSLYAYFASCLYGLVLIVAPTLADHGSVWFRIVFFILALAVTGYGVIHARKIEIKEVTIRLRNLPDYWKGKKIVWVSDLHLGQIYDRDFAAKVVGIVNGLDPEMVMIGGDLYDGVSVDADAIIAPFKELRATDGIFFITGNHEEFREKDKIEYLRAVADAGIRVLMNEKVDVNGLELIGIDDHDSHDADTYAAILDRMSIDRTRASILLQHEPIHLDIAAKQGVGLQISGHTHKAQVWPLNYVARMIYKGYEYGLHPFRDMLVYTSSGVGTWGPPLRVGSSAEIVRFTLIGV